jgi:alpha-L-rhamnosidase
MQQMAHALGRTEDERKYAQLFAKVREAFVKRYVAADGFIAGAPAAAPLPAAGNGAQKTAKPGDTQTGYVLALKMNLVPEALREASATRLAAKIRGNGSRLATGFLGTPYLLEVLVDTGHADLAYDILLNTNYPSWGYLVDHGATTMWERWNSDQMRSDPTMNSYNHYAYGSVADWIYRYAAGVDADSLDPGFHTVYLHPNFDRRVGNLAFAYESPYGEIRSKWSVKGKIATWTITIPANATGRLPLDEFESARMRVDGQKLSESSKVRLVARKSHDHVYELPAGTYTLRVRQN